MVAQVLHLCQPQVALPGVGSEPSLSELPQDGFEVVQMVGSGGGIDDIIQIGSGEVTVGVQHDVHEVLKCCGHPMEAKGENSVLPVA